MGWQCKKETTNQEFMGSIDGDHLRHPNVVGFGGLSREISRDA